MPLPQAPITSLRGLAAAADCSFNSGEIAIKAGIRGVIAAGAIAALAGITGCGAAGPDAAGTGATPGLNGPYGAGGPFATITRAGPVAAGSTPGSAGTAAPVRVDGSTALNGSHGVWWLSALGYGVSVSAPQDVQPSTASPGDAEAGFYDAYYDRRPASACGYVVPAERAQCPASLRRSLAAAGSLRNAAVGFVVVKADEAIVTLTGLVCGGPAADSCLGQHDPAWIFANAGTFDALWARLAAEGGNPLTGTPLHRVAGRWYVDLFLPSAAAG